MQHDPTNPVVRFPLEHPARRLLARTKTTLVLSSQLGCGHTHATSMPRQAYAGLGLNRGEREVLLTLCRTISCQRHPPDGLMMMIMMMKLFRRDHCHGRRHTCLSLTLSMDPDRAIPCLLRLCRTPHGCGCSLSAHQLCRSSSDLLLTCTPLSFGS